MTFEYELREEDFIKFNIYYGKYGQSSKKNEYIIKYLLPVLGSFAIYFIGTGLIGGYKSVWLIIALLYLIIWILRFPKTYENIIKKTVKDMIKNDDSYVYGRYFLDIVGDEVKITNEKSVMIYKKDAIKDIVRYEDNIYLLLSNIMGEIISTRGHSEEEIEGILSKLRS